MLAVGGESAGSISEVQSDIATCLCMTPVRWREVARRESWYSHISPVCFHYLPLQSTGKQYIYCQAAGETAVKGILSIKSCEVVSQACCISTERFLSPEELWSERRSGRSENVNIFPDNIEICEKEWSSELDQEIHQPSEGGDVPVKCLRLREIF